MEDSEARLRPGCAHRCRRSFSAVVCSIRNVRAPARADSLCGRLVFVSLLLLMLLELGLVVALALEVGYAVAGDASASSELFGWAFFLCPPLCALISPVLGLSALAFGSEIRLPRYYVVFCAWSAIPFCLSLWTGLVLGGAFASSARVLVLGVGAKLVQQRMMISLIAMREERQLGSRSWRRLLYMRPSHERWSLC
jgi:hypothetical protein